MWGLESMIQFFDTYYIAICAVVVVGAFVSLAWLTRDI